MDKNQLPGRNRLLIVFGVGALFVIAGTVAPRWLPLPATGESAVAREQEKPGLPATDNAASPSPVLVPDIFPSALRGPLERIVAGVCMVLIVGTLLVWFFRHRGWSKVSAAPGLLNVAAALALPHRCCVFLIEVGDQQLLAGVDSNGIHSVLPLPASAPEPTNTERDGILRLAESSRGAAGPALEVTA